MPDHLPPASAWPPPATPPTEPRHGRPPRRGQRRLVIGVAAVGLGLGGLVVAGQLASADDPVAVPPPVTGPPTDQALEDLLDEIPMSGALGGLSGLGDAATCMADRLGIDVSTDGMLPDLGRLGELTPEEMSAAWEACRSQLPDDVEATLDDVAACVERVTGDVPLPDPSEDVAAGGEAGVAVVTPDELSVLEFGEGDGTVTITKSGDEYTIESSGDVSATDLGSPDQLAADVEDALAGCEITLPFDLGRLDLGELLPD